MFASRRARFDAGIFGVQWAVAVLAVGWSGLSACGAPQAPRACEHPAVRVANANAVDTASKAKATPPNTVESSILAGRDRARPMVLLLSIDGLMPRHVLSADSLGLAIPSLRRFVREGAYAEGVAGVVPTLTYPAHTTLITGCGPARHGIAMNLTFDPTFKNQKGWFWYAADIRAKTLWEAAHEASLTTANLFWPVSVGAKNDWNLPQYWRAALPDDRKLYQQLSTPGLLEELEREVGQIPYGEDFSAEAEQIRTRYAEYVLTYRKPLLTTMYLGAFDDVQHRVGPKGKAALQMLEGIDGMVGRLRKTLETVAGDNYLMGIVSDHGFVDYETEIELPSLLQKAGLISLNGDNRVKSWRAAAWTAGGTGAVFLKDKADDGAKQIVERLILEIGKYPRCGVARVFRGAEISELNGFVGADYVIALRRGCKFGQNLTGPARIQRHGGTHGYLPDDREMDAALFLVGKGIPAARSLGRIDMRAIAPTLAAALGVALQDAELARLSFDVPAASKVADPSQACVAGTINGAGGAMTVGRAPSASSGRTRDGAVADGHFDCQGRPPRGGSCLAYSRPGR